MPGSVTPAGLRNTGEAVCWGSDEHDRTLSPAGTFTSISAGDYNSCAVRDTGEVDCWGYGYGGVYGDTEQPTGTFTAVSVGNQYNCGIRDTGAVVCWGPAADPRHDQYGVSMVPEGTFDAVSAGWLSQLRNP